MTSFCTKCQANDHTSCMIEYEGEFLCRKCQVHNEWIGGEFRCDCSTWRRNQLVKMIYEEPLGRQPFCHDCQSPIVRHATEEPTKEIELVNHPSHYQSDKFEVIDIIEAFNLGFNLGNAIKYILRAGKKDDFMQDLEKAAWYLQREIEKKN